MGKTEDEYITLYGEDGSPPRVRGILLSLVEHVGYGRFTPAGAGNTSTKNLEIHHVTVHPRGCGEYLYGILDLLDGDGSPPRVRGIPFAKFRLNICGRFTPAGAGNTMYDI